MDVVIVGAGPAGLSCAIELARLVKQDQEAGGGMSDLNIAVLEKAGSLGEHNLSGAVVNPRAFPGAVSRTSRPRSFPFRQPVEAESVYLLTERRAQRIPTPPTMHNRNYYTASICEIVRWLGERAEELGINLFAGFPVDGLLVDGNAVRGVRTTPSGLDREGQPTGDYTEPTDLTARVTVVAEGTRGLLSQAYRQWQKIGSSNPQLFALGVKEVWETRSRWIAWSTPWAGRCRPMRSGGASCTRWARIKSPSAWWSGLDYHDAGLDVHELLQRMKLHPLFRQYLEGGQLLEWGAKTIPGRRLLLASRATLRGRHSDGRGCGRIRGRAFAQGHPLRHAIGYLRRPGGVRRPQGGRPPPPPHSPRTTAW